MQKIDMIEAHILGLKEDFTVTDIIRTLKTKRCTTYKAVERLQINKKAFHVGYKQSKVMPEYLYSLENKPFSFIPIGSPKSEKACVCHVMLWLEGDFTVNDLAAWLNVAVTTVHQAKKNLFNEGLIFKVGEIHGPNSLTYVYNKEDKEYTATQDNELKQQRINRKVKKRELPKKTQPIYHPEDPLKGFVRPVATI